MMSSPKTPSSGKNNPGNLERNSIAWEGELPGDGRFADFDTLEHGTRAMLRVVVNKQRLHGCQTIAQVVDDFARHKASDHNDLSSYAAFMADRMGAALGERLTADSTIDLEAPATLTAWAAAQAWFESKLDLLSALGAPGLLEAAREALGL